MPRYIDVDGLPMYDELFMKGKNDSGVWVRYKDVEKLLRNAPTADVVEVVRCKDCKYYELIYGEGDNERLCNNGLGLQLINDDSYCPYGKRKEKTDG